MKRYLTWHVDRLPKGSGAQGPVYYADHDYTPGAVRLYARLAPAQELTVDILADGASILTSNYAVLNKGANLEEHAEDYPSAEPAISAGSVITFQVVSTGGAEDITCTLEMDSLNDEDDDETQ